MRRDRMKRFLAGILAGGLAVSSMFVVPMTVNATETTAGTVAEDDKELTPEEKQQKEYEEKLKKAYELPVQSNELTDWPQAVGTYGDAAIVMDAESGAILYAKNIDKQEYPASITKLLTALLAYEYDVMDLSVEITAECQECLGLGYAHIGSDVGDVLTMEQAMHAMLLASSNDIAYAIGETVAKSQGEDYAWFLERMNERCRELGGVNSNFINTNGVFNESHYSCALDMALIGKELFKYPEFFELCQTLQYTIPASEHSEEHVFQQKHEMLVPGYNVYSENVIGGKTGYTTEAQNTLVTMADNGELQLVCVVLYEYPGYVYTDTQALLDYGFANFERVSLSGDNEKEVKGLPEDIYITLPADITISDLKTEIVPGEIDGTSFLKYYYEDIQVSSYMADTNAVEEKVVLQESLPEEKEQEEGISRVLKIAGIAAVVLIVVLAAVLSYARAKKERQRKERLRRKREARRRAELAEREAQMAVKRQSAHERDPRLRYDIQNQNRKRPTNRNNQDMHRRSSGSQGMPRDRRPKNRRYD